jgi:hypothetical protein
MTTRKQAGPIRIVILRDTDRQKGAMRIKLRVAPPAAGLGFAASRPTIGLHEIHDEETAPFKWAEAARRDRPKSTKRATRSRRLSE